MVKNVVVLVTWHGMDGVPVDGVDGDCWVTQQVLARICNCNHSRLCNEANRSRTMDWP